MPRRPDGEPQQFSFSELKNLAVAFVACFGFGDLGKQIQVDLDNMGTTAPNVAVTKEYPIGGSDSSKVNSGYQVPVADIPKETAPNIQQTAAKARKL